MRRWIVTVVGVIVAVGFADVDMSLAEELPCVVAAGPAGVGAAVLAATPAPARIALRSAGPTLYRGDCVPVVTECQPVPCCPKRCCTFFERIAKKVFGACIDCR
jgi:hypothetical protein